MIFNLNATGLNNNITEHKVRNNESVMGIFESRELAFKTLLADYH